jgi:HD superfamily phosphohydrolase
MIYIDVCVTCSLCFSGRTYLVYPGPVHTGFEHSLGVYQLVGEAMQNLQMNQVCIIKHKFVDIYCQVIVLIVLQKLMHFFNQQGKELDMLMCKVQTVKLAGWCS